MKRGITPLMATVLLIAFAIAFGIFIMSIQSRVDAKESINATRYCGEIHLDFLNVNNSPYVCYDEESLSFIALNKGKIKIDGLQVILVGDSINLQDIHSSISPHNSYEGSISYNSSEVGTITEVQFIPKIDGISDTQILCVNDPVVIKPKRC